MGNFHFACDLSPQSVFHLVIHTKLMELTMFLIVQHVESDSHLLFPNYL